MKFVGILIGIAIILTAPFARGQDTTTSTSEAAPLVFWNRQITTFRSSLNQLTPSDRATRARERLASLPTNASEWRIVTSEATVGRCSTLSAAR